MSNIQKQHKISPAIAWLTIQKFIIFYCPLDGEHTKDAHYGVHDDVASVSVSLRSLLDERHWRSVTPQTLECAEAQSLLYLKQKRICTFVIQM